jgi:hypothetical protein
MDTDGSQGQKMEESFLLQERLLRGYHEKPQERKSNPAQGKEMATRSSSRTGGRDLDVRLKEQSTKPKDMSNLTPADIEEQKRRLVGIFSETLRVRRFARVCLRCGNKGHNQWFFSESRPMKAVTTVIQTQSIRPQKRKQDEPDIKEESALPNKKKKGSSYNIDEWMDL